MLNQEEQITEKRADIPIKYKPIYDRAMSGKSRKAVMHAFCLECVCWQIKEVHLCTAPACPLYPYRPTSTILQESPESVVEAAELIL